MSSHWAWSVPPATGAENGLVDSLRHTDTELATAVRAGVPGQRRAHQGKALSTPILPCCPLRLATHRTLPPRSEGASMQGVDATQRHHPSIPSKSALPGEASKGQDDPWLHLLPSSPSAAGRRTEDRPGARGHRSPMTLQSRRRLVVSPSPLSRGLSVQEGGSGIRSPMGRWNFRRLGSTVTMGLNVAWLPRSLVTRSSGTGWACEGPEWGRSAPAHRRGLWTGNGTALKGRANCPCRVQRGRGGVPLLPDHRAAPGPASLLCSLFPALSPPRPAAPPRSRDGTVGAQLHVPLQEAT